MAFFARSFSTRAPVRPLNFNFSKRSYTTETKPPTKLCLSWEDKHALAQTRYDPFLVSKLKTESVSPQCFKKRETKQKYLIHHDEDDMIYYNLTLKTS